MRSTRAVLCVGLAVTLASSAARADGIDLVPYFTRVGGGHSTVTVLGLVVGMMVINYGVNLLVVGVPAFKVGPASARSIALGLVWMTLLGQVADRVGAFFAVLGAGPVAGALHLKGEGAWVLPLALLNFFFSGIAIGVLAHYFLRRRWQVASRPAWIIALAAGIVTNPAWVIGLWFT